MIVLLYGSDSYRRRQKLKEIVLEYEKKHRSVGYFDFKIKEKDEEFNRLREFCASHSLFENVKLAVVENILSDFSKDETKITAEFLKANLENKELTILLSEEKAPLKEFKFLINNQHESVLNRHKSAVLFQEFKNLSARQLEFFIKKEAEKRGVKLSIDAIIFLANIFSEDAWGLINELEKISLFDNKNFNAEKLKEIIDYDKPNIGNEFFKRVSALAFGRSLRDKIIDLEILLNREEPAKIFNSLASFSSNPPELIRQFADYDIAVKSGKMDYEEVLVDFALNGH